MVSKQSLILMLRSCLEFKLTTLSTMNRVMAVKINQFYRRIARFKLDEHGNKTFTKTFTNGLCLASNQEMTSVVYIQESFLMFLPHFRKVFFPNFLVLETGV